MKRTRVGEDAERGERHRNLSICLLLTILVLLAHKHNSEPGIEAGNIEKHLSQQLFDVLPKNMRKIKMRCLHQCVKLCNMECWRQLRRREKEKKNKPVVLS